MAADEPWPYANDYIYEDEDVPDEVMRVHSMEEYDAVEGRNMEPKSTVGTTGSDEDGDDKILEEDAPLEESGPPTLSSRPEHYSISELVSNLGGDEADLHPALERRIRDFRFAQRKRRETYGNERPWGILGLYDHLASIRIDLEWAEDAAWRRAHNEPYLSWKDFEKERRKGHNRPFFTYFLLGICTIMLIVSIAMNGGIEPLSVNPMVGPSAETLLDLGAKQSSLIVNAGQWYRLIAPMVLHAGVFHYLLNMLALWFIGGAVEISHGFLAAAIIFIISAIGGTILSAICLPQYISVGASGGIFGLIGACIADICLNWNLLFLDEEQRFRVALILLWLVFDIVINCLIGLTPFVDNFTHLGGLIYGFLCGLSTIERLPAQSFFGMKEGRWAQLRNNLVRFAGLIVSVVLIMVTIAVLVNSDGQTSPCHGCRYVSCVPFPPGAGTKDKWWYCDDCDVNVEANALKEDPANPDLFTALELSCPDGAVEYIELMEDERTADAKSIQKRLPSYCRNNCEDVFST